VLLLLCTCDQHKQEIGYASCTSVASLRDLLSACISTTGSGRTINEGDVATILAMMAKTHSSLTHIPPRRAKAAANAIKLMNKTPSSRKTPAVPADDDDNEDDADEEKETPSTWKVDVFVHAVQQLV
jgi:hypothetical protein